MWKLQYVLPMYWHGVPVSLWCPKPPPLPREHPTAVLPSAHLLQMSTGASCCCDCISLDVANSGSVTFLHGCSLYLCTSSMAGPRWGSMPTTNNCRISYFNPVHFGCTGLKWLSSKNVEQETIMEARTGSIPFKGKALDSQLESVSSTATGNGEVLSIDMGLAHGTGMLQVQVKKFSWYEVCSFFRASNCWFQSMDAISTCKM